MGKDLNGNELGRGYSQRKDGRYEARAVINGIKIDLYDMNLGTLRKMFDAEKSKVLIEELNDRSGLTLEEWYTEWFDKSKAPSLKSEVSCKAYNRKCRNTYIRLLGKKSIRLVSQINIQDATNQLVDENYSHKVIKEGLGVLRECFEIAVANRIVPANPCTNIKFRDGNEAKKDRRVLSHKEQDIFIKEVTGTYYEEPFKILLLTGLRIGEFAGLQWSDIDWDNKYIKISRSMQTAYQDGKKIELLTTPKTVNSYREVPFFAETEKLLKSWKSKQESVRRELGSRWRCKPEHGDLVFTNTQGSPMTRYVLAHIIKKIEDNIRLKEMESAMREGRQPSIMEHIHPHAFRHTFATRCFEKGLDPLFVQNIMGHSNYSTTLSYTHVLEDTRQKELSKIVGDFLD